ncbi:hypothetical protein K438DRAFT_1759014 [Mycena galopus ATCC 62051]|nr:hypothetical protein K438DRAFT_1759014 [Mycena galopus ATCC 62051]
MILSIKSLRSRGLASSPAASALDCALILEIDCGAKYARFAHVVKFFLTSFVDDAVLFVDPGDLRVDELSQGMTVTGTTARVIRSLRVDADRQLATTPMSSATFLVLPIELLLNILEHPTFPTQALYSLALLCRRFNLLTMPIYFSRRGIDLESVTLEFQSDRSDTLSALQICLSISAVDRISCCDSIAPLITQMKQLQTFIARLSSVNDVAPNLEPSGCTHPRLRCLSVGADNVLEDWAHQYGDLLGRIVQKECKFLTVINGGQLTDTYELKPPGNSARRLPSANRRLLGFRRRPRTTFDYDLWHPQISSLE